MVVGVCVRGASWLRLPVLWCICWLVIVACL